MGCEGVLGLEELLRRAFQDDFSAPVAPFRTQIDDPIGVLHNLQVVFDEDRGVPLFQQPVQDGGRLSAICLPPNYLTFLEKITLRFLQIRAP